MVTTGSKNTGMHHWTDHKVSHLHFHKNLNSQNIDNCKTQ